MNTLGQLNNYSAQSIAFTDEALGGQTLPARYKINGVIDTGRPVMENMDKIASAAGSWMSYDSNEGKWGVIINQAGTSVASFNDSNILGDIAISGTGLTDLFTGVNVEFPHRDLRDKADFVTIELPEGDLNANETTSIQNIAYDIINEPIQAQLLGFIELKQSRVDLVIKFQSDYSKSNLKAGELIDVTNTRFGFTNKLFRILSIFEKDDDNGSIIMEITALEYDADVYSTADLYRYTRTDENGIITKGAIGTPGTPQVSKFERDARPRIELATLSPSGIVEGIEYWITYDVSVQNDINRNYRLLGTRQPTVNRTWPEGSEVVFEWDSLATGDFYIKTRGVNSTAVGPFSTVSGLINYNPVQTTNAISPDTSVVDNTGALLTALGGSFLLNQLSGLITGNASTGSLFKSIFKLFEDETGTDLLGQAADGSLVVAGDTGVAYNGQMLTTSTRLINFTGTAVTATANGNDVTVTINCCGTGTNTGTNTGTTSTPVVSYLTLTNKLPPDRTTYRDPITGQTSDQAPTTGSYFLSYRPYSAGAAMYGPLVAGSGSAKLYKSNGALVETLSAGSLIINNDLVEFPFAARDLGTDYYILVDEGIVSYCNIKNAAMSTPYDWNFNTPLYTVDSYTATNISISSATTIAPTISNISPAKNSVDVANNSILYLYWNTSVVKGSGNIYIHNYAGDAVVGTIPVSGTTVSGTMMTCGNIQDYVTAGNKYYVTADAGVVKSPNLDCYNIGLASNPITKADDWNFTIIGPLLLVSFEATSSPLDVSTNTNKVNPQANIKLIFNRNVQWSTIGGTFTIKDAGGGTYQDFNVQANFTQDKVSEVLWIDGPNVYLNPTKDFNFGATYYVNGTNNSVRDYYGNAWGGLSNSTTVRFTVDPGPSAVSIPITDTSSNIAMVFDRDIEPGPGVVRVYDNNNTLLAEIPSDDPRISYS